MFCPNCGKQIPPESKFCPLCGYSISGQPPVPTPGVVASSGYMVASKGLRFVHGILDGFFSWIFTFVIALVLGIILSSSGADKTFGAFLGLFYWVLWLGYFLLFEGLWQRTPAKWITKTKVVMRDGSKPDFKHILGRTFARLIPFDGLSFLVIPVGWHDSLSKTVVVPAHYTPEEVRQIDLNAQPKSGAGLVIIIIVCVLVFIAVLGLLSSVVLLSLNSARGKARDAKRDADVRQIQSALEIYYSDKSTYPTSLGVFQSEPYNLSAWSAPTPPDGDCTAENNQYVYTSSGADYKLTFCLGGIVGTLPAGVHSVSREGFDQAVSSSTNAAVPSNNSKPTNLR